MTSQLKILTSLNNIILLSPGEILLTLVLHTFVDQIEAYKKDSNVNVTPEEVVKDILKGITHVENLLANKTTMQGSNSCALKDALKKVVHTTGASYKAMFEQSRSS